MKFKGIAIWTVVLFIFFISALNADEVFYQKLKLEGVRVHVVTVNLNSPNVRVKPVLAQRNNGLRNPAEYFWQFIYRLTPKAMINGTFHDTKTYNLAGTVILDGKIKSFYRRGVAIIFNSDNRIDFLPAKYLDRKQLFGVDAITAGPTLLLRGKLSLSPRNEGFFDPALYRRAKRSALGKTAGNKFLLVTVDNPIYLKKLASIMRKLKCVDAVSLDGGGSSGLYYRGKTLTRPIRPITNVVVVYEKKRGAGLPSAQKAN